MLLVVERLEVLENETWIRNSGFGSCEYHRSVLGGKLMKNLAEFWEHVSTVKKSHTCNHSSSEGIGI